MILRNPAWRQRPRRLVEIDVRLLVGGTVTAAIDQIERFAGVGQRDQQCLITPVAVVVDVDALLALGIGRNVGAVGVEESFLEELIGLLGPDVEADTIDGVHQSLDVGRHEAPAEITFGGGIGNSLGAQGVEIDLVVATQLKMFEVLATGDDVESDVQDVVGFVVGQMSFEKVEIPIDSVDEADLLSQQKNGTDGTDHQIGANIDHLERATGLVIDPSVSF